KVLHSALASNFCSSLPHKMLVLLVALWAIPILLEAQPYNSPCDALLYEFNNGTNIVPCGPAANATPQVDIHGNGPSGVPVNGSCGLPGNGGSPTDALWVSFVIQEGGSYEWQTVPGADDFYWELYASLDPVDTPAEESDQSGCGSLQFLECGAEFTGWKVQSTPDASLRWRFYMVFFLRNGDQQGDGVIKIRKSCGEGCLTSTIDVVASAADACINLGDNTQLNAIPSGGGGGPYTYTWTPSATLNNAAIQNPIATPLVTTTYTVKVVGADRCPATDEVTVEVGCCDADAGTVTNNGTGPFTVCKNHDIVQGNTEIIFDASGENTLLAYAFILADANGNIVAYNTTGNFGPIANTGTYTVYGLSFDEAQNGQTVTAYLGTVTTIAQIEASVLCLDLVSGAPGNNIIKVVEPECGNF
ncbi:MAG: hypothetical protein Q7U74_01780, partial [Saprospiraceae bacterium]|nr:hypothetical protein [Saprospiraceae bacterium]